MLKKMNESGKVLLLLLVSIGIIMFLFNRLTPMLVDDYSYCYSYVDRSRITSISQIIPSMLAHYNSMNGRLIAHGFVQLMLMMPDWVFDLINSVIYCILCMTVYDYIWKLYHEKHNAVLLAAVFGAFWVCIPSYGEVFLWLDGSCNYLWCTAALLLFIRPALADWPHKDKPSFWVLYILTGFIMGGLIETVSFAVMIFFVLYTFCQRVFMSRKIKLWRIYPSFLLLPGYLYMISSPGLKSNKMGVKIYVGAKFVEAFIQYTSTLKWLLIFGIIMTVFLFTFHIAKERLWKAAMWFCLSFGMSCMHCVTTYYPKRSMIGVAVFLIIADGELLAGLFENADVLESFGNSSRYLANCVCALLFLQAFTQFIPGGYDIYQAWKQIKHNEEYIQAEVAAGSQEITIGTIWTTTSYSAVHELKYIDTDTYDSWPNMSMAKYYGAERIYGRKNN